MAVSHVKSNTIADFTGTVTVYNSQGSTTTVNATDIVRPSDWNSGHNQYVTIGGNTQGTSALSGTNIYYYGAQGISLSGSQGANAATISVLQDMQSNVYYPPMQFTTVSAIGNGQASFEFFPAYGPLSASVVAMYFSVTGSTSGATNSGGLAVSQWFGIYTRNSDTLGTLTTASQNFSTWCASNATGSVFGIREIDLPVNMYFDPGEYYLAANFSTATAGNTSLSRGMTIFGGVAIGTAANAVPFGSTAGIYGANVGYAPGMGVVTAASAGLPNTIHISNVVGTGTAFARAVVKFDLRNSN